MKLKKQNEEQIWPARISTILSCHTSVGEFAVFWQFSVARSHVLGAECQLFVTTAKIENCLGAKSVNILLWRILSLIVGDFFFFEMKYWIRFRQPVKIDQQTGSRVSTGFAIVRISASEHKIYWKRKKKVFSPFLYLFLHFVDCDCEGLVPSLLRVWFTFFIHINRHNFTISFSATFLFNVCTTHTHSRFPFGLTPAAFLR